jgi:hypothetical protein
MGLKANLRVKLYADDNVVAEIENTPLMLWQQLLAHSEGLSKDASIQPPSALILTKEIKALQPTIISPLPPLKPETTATAERAITEMASAIGVTADAISSALDPTQGQPYICLEHTYWETFRNNVSKKGRGSIGPSIVAATLLALWKLYSKATFPLNTSSVSAALGTISIDDKNAVRSIKKCKWLKIRSDGEIAIIPDSMSKARAVAKAFCLKQGIKHDEHA